MSLTEKLMNIFKGNKPTKAELAHRARLQTANEFINVKDVRGSILYTKDNRLFSFLRINPISLELLSPREKDKKIKNFATEFSSENKSFKFFSISRPVDVSGISSWLTGMLQEATDPIQKEMLINEIKETGAFAITGEVIERQFYLIIWESANEDGQREILRRANELENKLSGCEIVAELCSQDAIVRLLNLFANPNFAHMEDGEFEPAIPVIR